MNSAKQIEACRRKVPAAVQAHKTKAAAKRAAIMAAIANEFEEPFYDVISGFAALGHSRFDTANILGVSDYLLSQMLREFPPVQWPNRYKSVGFLQANIGKKDKRVIEFSGKAKTVSEWARHAGTSQQNLYKRIARFGTERALSRDSNAET